VHQPEHSLQEAETEKPEGQTKVVQKAAFRSGSSLGSEGPVHQPEHSLQEVETAKPEGQTKIVEQASFRSGISLGSEGPVHQPEHSLQEAETEKPEGQTKIVEKAAFRSDSSLGSEVTATRTGSSEMPFRTMGSYDFNEAEPCGEDIDIGIGAAIKPTSSERLESSSTKIVDSGIGAATMPTCSVRAKCSCTKLGESLAIVGEDPGLGAWEAGRAVVLATGEDAWPLWTGEVPVPVPGSKFKLIIFRPDGSAEWEPLSDNRTWPEGQLPELHYGSEN